MAKSSEVLVGLRPLTFERQESWRDTLRSSATRRQLIALLGRTRIFADTREKFREDLVSALVPAEYGPRQVVFRRGDPGDWMGIVLRGRVEQDIIRQVAIDVYVGALGPGSVFGELGVFGILPTRYFTITAIEPTLVLALSLTSLQEVAARSAGPRMQALLAESVAMREYMASVPNGFLSLPCFKHFETECAIALWHHAEVRLGYPGQVVVSEIMQNDESYIVLTGSLEVRHQGNVIDRLESGSMVDELAVKSLEHNHTIRCADFCLLCVLKSEIVTGIIKCFPASKRTLDHSIVQRILSKDVRHTAQEKTLLDNCFGCATPRTKQEMDDIFGRDRCFVIPNPRVCTQRRPQVWPKSATAILRGLSGKPRSHRSLLRVLPTRSQSASGRGASCGAKYANDCEVFIRPSSAFSGKVGSTWDGWKFQDHADDTSSRANIRGWTASPDFASTCDDG